MITEQGIIDKTIQGFLIDKKPAGWNPEDAACVYWNRITGARCGVGNLLSKKTLTSLRPEDQAGSIGMLIKRMETMGTCAEDLEMLKKHSVLIGRVQAEHDAAATSSLSYTYGPEEEVDQEQFRERLWYNMRRLIEAMKLDDSLLPSLEV